MTLQEFLDHYNLAPYDILERARVATEIEDYETLQKAAADVCTSIEHFVKQLEIIGYEFG